MTPNRCRAHGALMPCAACHQDTLRAVLGINPDGTARDPRGLKCGETTADGSKCQERFKDERAWEAHRAQAHGAHAPRKAVGS